MGNNSSSLSHPLSSQLRITLRVPDIQKMLEMVNHASILRIYNFLAIGCIDLSAIKRIPTNIDVAQHWHYKAQLNADAICSNTLN